MKDVKKWVVYNKDLDGKWKPTGQEYKFWQDAHKDYAKHTIEWVTPELAVIEHESQLRLLVAEF